jgi:kynurenine formamidase
MRERVEPSEGEVRSWLASLSNWGRWGSEDQRGTLNYVDEDRVRKAATLVRSGELVSCSLPITYGPSEPDRAPDLRDPAEWSVPRHFVIQDGAGSTPGSSTRVSTYDGFQIAPHGEVVTHLDAPSHTLLNGTMYNGSSSGLVNREQGATAGSVELAGTGVASRGVLLDVPGSQGRKRLDEGEAIFPVDLEACENWSGVKVERGDILMVRTGHRESDRPGRPGPTPGPRPGLQAACLPWLHEREVAVIASDVPVDVRPHPYASLGLPIHTVGMWAMGLWLLDNCDLEALAAACVKKRRWEYLCVLSPLVLRYGTGSPINPIAIF